MTIIEKAKNTKNGGYYAVFEHNNSYYYGDLAFLPIIGSEFMVFPCTKDGDVTSWIELYVIRGGLLVNEKCLMECINEFCKDNP